MSGTENNDITTIPPQTKTYKVLVLRNPANKGEIIKNNPAITKAIIISRFVSFLKLKKRVARSPLAIYSVKNQVKVVPRGEIAIEVNITNETKALNVP